MDSREDLIYRARLAEQGERYKDMIEAMKSAAQVSVTSKLNQIISMAYSQAKNAICYPLRTKTRLVLVEQHGGRFQQSRTRKSTKDRSTWTWLSSTEGRLRLNCRKFAKKSWRYWRTNWSRRSRKGSPKQKSFTWRWPETTIAISASSLLVISKFKFRSSSVDRSKQVKQDA